jgi:quercetin dioxygenase-like cupin family protein
MPVKTSDVVFQELLPGIRMKPLACGQATMMCEFRLRAGSDLPLHDHPHEQIGYLLSGRMVLRVNDQDREVGPGDSWCIPGGVRHGVTVQQDAVVIEVFSPPRQDYLPDNRG